MILFFLIVDNGTKFLTIVFLMGRDGDGYFRFLVAIDHENVRAW